MKTIKTPYLLLLLSMLIPSFSQASDINLSCPDKPNCVSSGATGDHYIEPLTMKNRSVPDIKQTLENILSHWPRTEITSSESNIITAVVSSRWMGFKDDLTLIIHPDWSVDVRSASRSGYYDFGVNRDRVEQLRREAMK